MRQVHGLRRAVISRRTAVHLLSRVDPAAPWALDAATVDHGSPQALVRQVTTT